MNLKLVTINVVVLILVVESHAGVIDGVYGRIKNTTTGLTQDLKNVWSYSKALVGQGDTTSEQKEEERGFIGGMIHSVREKAHAFHEFWVIEEIPNDSGLLWNMYCRMKQRLAKAKNYILGNEDKPIEDTQPPHEETEIIKDTMDKLFNVDGTRKLVGDAFTQAVENLRKKLNEIRKKSTTTDSPVHHGEGLIDVRLADVHKDFEDNAADAAGVGNDIYDKVYDNMNTATDKISDNANSRVETIKTGLNRVQDGFDGLKDKISDVVAKEKDLLDNTYSKLNQGAKDVSDNAKKSADDMTRMAYP